MANTTLTETRKIERVKRDDALTYEELSPEQRSALENNLVWRFLEYKAEEEKAFATFYRQLFGQSMLNIRQRRADWQRWLVDKVWQSPKLEEDHNFFDSLNEVEGILLLDFLEALKECRRSYFQIVHNSEGEEGILHEYARSRTRIYKDGSSFRIT